MTRPSMALLVAAACLCRVARAEDRVVTLGEALTAVQKNNLTWQSLDEHLVQAEAFKRLGVGMWLPKVQIEGQWVHQGDRHVPDFSSFNTMGSLLNDLVTAVVTEHPSQTPRFAPYFSAQGSGSTNSLEAFVAPADMLSATFSVIVPIINPEAIPFLRGALSQRDATLQRIGFGREQLLFGVAKAYYGLLTLQSMREVAEQSRKSAEQHFRSNEVKANLQAATKLEVKRAELEVTRAESQIAEINANLARAKAAFRYLTGVTGDFAVVDPGLDLHVKGQGLAAWQGAALEARKDLIAAHIEVEVADREIGKVVAKYWPNVNFIAQGKADNTEQMRFDDDPYSWLVMATASINVFDGGIREAQLAVARSQYRQRQMAAVDLEQKIRSDVDASFSGLDDARAARQLAERQVEVARAALALAVAGEGAGVTTNLEIIDTHTVVFSSEAQALTARFREATALLDLLAAVGEPVPFAPSRRE